MHRQVPVIWGGELVALAGPERFHIVSPALAHPDARPEDLEYVAMLCLFHRLVLLGLLPAPRDERAAERWVDVQHAGATDASG
jgi:hypothetical protein